MSDIPSVSTTNTKAQILKAYKELAAMLKQERDDNVALKRELEKKRRIVERAEEATQADAPQGIAVLRKALNDQLDKIERAMAEEQEKFEQLQQAIAIEREALDELYKIRAEAESLDALIITNKQAREKLEREMAERKEELEGQIADTRLRWKREQEEYEYHLRIMRRKEEDEYQEQKARQEKELAERKAAFEKEVAERSKALKEQEDELAALRKQAAEFDTRLQKAVAETEKAVSQRLTREFEYNQKLQAKDLEAELKLSRQEVESLRGKIKEQQELIASLSSKSDTATQQVKDIALKAIENAGARQFQSYPPERRGGEGEKKE